MVVINGGVLGSEGRVVIEYVLVDEAVIVEGSSVSAGDELIAEMFVASDLVTLKALMGKIDIIAEIMTKMKLALLL